ncbi:MAG: hypothetical protein JNG85_14975, partial [Spirochaetaceae bacterium]|nr:hypothetical protein [Spirochaetaceae bacterium]
MHTAHKTLVAIALTTALVSGCSFGRGQGTVNLGFEGTNSGVLARSVNVAGARAVTPTKEIKFPNGDMLTLGTASVGIKEIEFEIDLDALPESEKEAFATDEWEFVGPYRIDLLAGSIT